MKSNHNNSEKFKKTTEKDQTTLKEAPFLAIKGFLMGSADIVPGVSGGTMALIVGIYERLLNAIKSVNGNFLNALFSFRIKDALAEVHFFFIGVLFFGIFSAFAFFTIVVPLQVYMFTEPEIVFGLFFGLILGSIYILYKTLDRFTKVEFGALILGIAFGLWIVTLVPTDTPENPAFVFLSGMIAICAMILPGISGSYLLLIMRKYDYLLSEISKIGQVDTAEGLINLAPFVLGAIVGLAVFSRFLSWLLSKYHPQTITLLIGFLIGSLVVIWPFQDRVFQESVREVKVTTMADPEAKALAESEVNTNLPEYKRIGKEISPTANFDEFKRVEIETVKNKLISSKPFVPGLIESSNPEKVPNVWGGFIGIFVGMILVGGLDLLRKKS